ncbi:MAG TPA: hypothetical protein VKS24_09405 [Bradyrhizobium sp.]|nr:hypothetical protein [Bradyrhizobium sp.]
MPSDDRERQSGRDSFLASLLIVAGIVISGVSLVEIAKTDGRMAQTTQPSQPSPPPESNDRPAESKPSGVRPTTPAPEPAQPSAQAQKEGVKPALPPAPAEKMAPPMKDR